MLDGFLLIDKPIGMTSNDVVRLVKKTLHVSKVGHSGTLDPDVTGLIVIAINNATKLLPLITTDSQKEYDCELLFGIQTDSDDISGEILKKEDVQNFTQERLINKLSEFEKTYDQFPPIYSAKRVNGKRLYEYARENLEVEIKPSTITIFKNTFTSYEANKLRFLSTVSKGTYMRSLCRDIANSLDTIGTMSYLRRTKTDGFDVKDAYSIDEIDEDKIIKVSDFVSKQFPIYEVYGPISEMISNGVVLNQKPEYEYPCIYKDRDSQKLIAIYKPHKENKVKPLVML